MKRFPAVFLFFLFLFPNGGPLRAEEGEPRVNVDFTIEPLAGEEVREGKDALVKFGLARDGEPLRSLRPSVWIDAKKEGEGGSEGPARCEAKVAAYLEGKLFGGPRIDLSKYFILTLNKEPTISVIDPVSGVQGMTRLYTMIYLKKPGSDWAESADGKSLFVSMPEAGGIAVIDLESFKLKTEIEAEAPSRLALQPEGKYLLVSYKTKKAASGIKVIDTETMKPAASIKTGAGPHEIAFSEGGRYALATNSGAGSLSVIDMASLKEIKNIRVEGRPVALASSGRSVYIASENGSITVLDGKTFSKMGRIKTQGGLETLALSPNFRWGFALAPAKRLVHIFGTEKNVLLHTLKVKGRPGQVSFTGEYAYILSNGTKNATLAKLADIGNKPGLDILNIGVGPDMPAISNPVSASAMYPAPEGRAMLISSPEEKIVYYHKEETPGAFGRFRSYGQTPLAVMAADRALRETGDGTYSGTIRVPESGKYDVALFLDSPRTIICREFEARPDPALAGKRRLKIEVLDGSDTLKARAPAKFRFKLTDSSSNPAEGVNDLIMLASSSTGKWRERLEVKEWGAGIYEAEITFPVPGNYYVYFRSQTLKADYNRMPNQIIRAVD